MVDNQEMCCSPPNTCGLVGEGAARAAGNHEIFGFGNIKEGNKMNYKNLHRSGCLLSV